MNRIRAVISYDGTNFSGYQIQPNGRTVQEEIEKALVKIHKGLVVRVVASGRTDAKVHAKGQVVHFDSHLNIPNENWKRALNALMPEDIYVKEAFLVDQQFHARFDVVEKEYRYIIHTAEKDIFLRNYVYAIHESLNIQAMSDACQYVVGEHDFTSFCAANTNVKGDKIRTIYHATCTEVGDKVTFTFKGSGFLYNMVRILVGTMIEVGREKLSPQDMVNIIEAKDRKKAGKTAPPQGLYLWNVVYPNDKDSI
ncbi:tRNA pseudouridine(38-40) synthase TruA [Aquibacillus kalidii]|uniref:tRNA pseudouridine(38-40) synthase TruA n=1 Tax=Aquibacillus kalidii TaxID=2762597 RepID=UPI0016495E5B|nr:tRNA pseudouridine(38-40) synthase TruA [Aquibacillus kalidii]